MWRASTAHTEVVTKLLRTLRLGRKSLAHITITPSGLRVQTASPSRVFNGQLFLESSLFATYECDGELSATLSVAALVNCLQMFAEWAPAEEHAGCFFEYIEGAKFQLSFAHDTMTSVCDLRLLALESSLTEIAFDAERVQLQVIMPAGACLNVLRDLEAVGAEEVEFATAGDALEVRATGDLARTEFVLPNEPGVLDALVADGAVRQRFAFEHVAKAMDAVRLAKKVSLRFDGAALSVQCLCEVGDLSAYIEFRVLANL